MRFTHQILGSLLFAGSLVLVGCSEPVSSATALVTGERNIRAIAVDDFFVYWASQDGSTKRVSRDGGKITTLVEGQTQARHIAVDEADVYSVATDGQVARVAKEGGAAEPLAIADVDSDLAIDPAHVYFTTSAGTVQQRAKADGATADLAADHRVETAFAIAGSSLVFGAASGEASALNEMLTTDGAVDTLVSGSQPDDVALNSANVYWTDSGNLKVGVANRDGSNVYQIPALGQIPSSVMGDDTYVYFADVSGAVNVAAIHGGDAVQLAKGPRGKVSMAMDETTIYFANSADEAIIAMPRQ